MPTIKLRRGKDPEGCFRYVFKEDAKLLETNMAGSSPEQLTREFGIAIQKQQRLEIVRPTKNVVHHASISFDPSFELTQAQKKRIARRYLEEMGFTDNQYLTIEHHDTDHAHIHIVANRVRLDGTTVDPSYDFRRAQLVMRGIEADYGMKILPNSWEVDVKAPTVAEVRKARSSGEPIPRVVVQQAIEAIAPTCTTIAQLQERLQKSGITLAIASRLSDAMKDSTRRLAIKKRLAKKHNLKLASQPLVAPSLLFSCNGITFSATKLGKRYGWKGLQSYFNLKTSTTMQQPASSILSPQFCKSASLLAHFRSLNQWVSKLLPPELLINMKGEAQLLDLFKSTRSEASSSATATVSAQTAVIRKEDRVEDKAKIEQASNTANDIRSQYKEALRCIHNHLRQQSKKPITDVQIACVALSEVDREKAKLILTQTTAAQKLYKQSGLDAANKYLDKLIQQAEQQLQAQRRSSHGER